MFEFNHPEYLLYLLLLLPLAGLGLWAFWYRRRSIHRLVPQIQMRDLVMPERIGRKRLTRDALFLSAIGFIIIALARPQTPGKTSKMEDQRGIEAMICIDVSNSMLSNDVAPSRMSFAKKTISELLSQMKSDKVGIIIFAAEAYVQLPITTDISTAQEFLSDVSPAMLSAQGTNIADAIQIAQTAFSDRKDIGKSIIIVTDGESHEGGAEEAATLAAREGIRVNILGIGTEKGGIIPQGDQYLKNDSGQIVTTRLNTDMCRVIAQAGDGGFFAGNNQRELVSALKKQLDRLPKAAIGQIDRAGYIEHFAPWVLSAMILLILELFISQRRNRLWRRYNIFGHEKK